MWGLFKMTSCTFWSTSMSPKEKVMKCFEGDGTRNVGCGNNSTVLLNIARMVHHFLLDLLLVSVGTEKNKEANQMDSETDHRYEHKSPETDHQSQSILKWKSIFCFQRHLGSRTSEILESWVQKHKRFNKN